MNTENAYFDRIEELETALENLIECFEREGGRPWIEVEVQDDIEPSGLIITLGQVNQFTANAVEFAEKVLWNERDSYVSEDVG